MNIEHTAQMAADDVRRIVETALTAQAGALAAQRDWQKEADRLRAERDALQAEFAASEARGLEFIKRETAAVVARNEALAEVERARKTDEGALQAAERAYGEGYASDAAQCPYVEAVQILRAWWERGQALRASEQERKAALEDTARLRRANEDCIAQTIGAMRDREAARDELDRLRQQIDNQREFDDVTRANTAWLAGKRAARDDIEPRVCGPDSGMGREWFLRGYRYAKLIWWANRLGEVERERDTARRDAKRLQAERDAAMGLLQRLVATDDELTAIGEAVRLLVRTEATE